MSYKIQQSHSTYYIHTHMHIIFNKEVHKHAHMHINPKI